MTDKRTRLEDELLNQQVERIGRQAGESHPEDRRAPSTQHLLLIGVKCLAAPVHGPAPHQKHDYGQTEDQIVRTKDHQSIQPGMLASMAVNRLKQGVVQLQKERHIGILLFLTMLLGWV